MEQSTDYGTVNRSKHEVEPGPCGDPDCQVLHTDPSNPIHPPFYEDEQDGIWVASSLGVSFHCECGWVSERYEAEKAAVEAEVGAHVEECRG